MSHKSNDEQRAYTQHTSYTSGMYNVIYSTYLTSEVRANSVCVCVVVVHGVDLCLTNDSLSGAGTQQP